MRERFGPLGAGLSLGNYGVALLSEEEHALRHSHLSLRIQRTKLQRLCRPRPVGRNAGITLLDWNESLETTPRVGVAFASVLRHIFNQTILVF
jgi:hypothetical protein